LSGAAIDSRRVAPGNVFACLGGEHVDGHDFAVAARAAGAALLLCQRPIADDAGPQLVVADVTAALAALATAFRSAYAGACWLAVTGSNGKTTVKELLGRACGHDSYVTVGNLNNHLGVPLTVLNTPADCQYVVCELGASAAGEIAALTAIVQPDVGVITGIGSAHLDGFGDLLGVAAGKSELFTGMTAGAPMLFARYGLDDVAEGEAILRTVQAAAEHGVLRVVGGPGCPVAGVVGSNGIELHTPIGKAAIALVGAHNLANACLAWYAAVAAGVEPAEALQRLAGGGASTGRLASRRLGDHRLLDDSYNANPASVRAGLQALAAVPGARLAVLGAMAELGPSSDALHRDVGAAAAGLGLSLVTVGAGAQAIASGYCDAGGRDHDHMADLAAAEECILNRLAVGPTTVLIKASRSAGLDRLARSLIQRLGYGSSSHVIPEEARRC
jgi:UDP-N-acetylmuramoyl-tripeptide--D-alanyl-D-alanine ligase